MNPALLAADGVPFVGSSMVESADSAFIQGPVGRTQRHVEMAAIRALLPARSPRQAGEDEAHAEALAQVDTPLPPILVHRQTMRVIDGMHRLRAALIQGREEIAVEFFEGSEEEAFLLAVWANTRHGMPLTTRDRQAAAARILRTHPAMSDRAIADIAGLAARTVRGLRSRSTGESPQSNTRIGKDGRERPVDPKSGRRRVVEALMANPEAPLRQIAARAGVSVGTAHAVKTSLRSGNDPLDIGRGSERQADAPRTVAPQAGEPAGHRAGLDRLESLVKDPSLRFSEGGRELLRWFQAQRVARRNQSLLISSIPPHLVPVVIDMAHACADAWNDFARTLDELGNPSQ
ncbi:streptomycin biosynthesis regulator [Spirillospora sp. NPDC050679]